jgi:hypothetical protein
MRPQQSDLLTKMYRYSIRLDVSVLDQRTGSYRPSVAITRDKGAAPLANQKWPASPSAQFYGS